jgi:hypothetical protein
LIAPKLIIDSPKIGSWASPFYKFRSVRVTEMSVRMGLNKYQPEQRNFMIASVPEQQIAAKENKFDILVIALS